MIELLVLEYAHGVTGNLETNYYLRDDMSLCTRLYCTMSVMIKYETVHV
jgi:hypothetical protein